MNKIVTIITAIILFVSCDTNNQNKTILTTDTATVKLHWPDTLPIYDHIVIVVEENKDYSEILDKNLAPYINEVILAEGANFTNMYAEEHHSQGNYFWLFSGDNQNVGFGDTVPVIKFETANLASQLIAIDRTFSGYSEGLPFIGSDTVATYSILKYKEKPIGIYGRKHVPWVSFSNVPDSLNKRFIDFPLDFNKLPTVSFVIPNLNNDMHNGPDSLSIPIGDEWLAENLDRYYQWAKAHNSLLILTFDENDDLRHYKGLTDPDTIHSIDSISNPRFRVDYENKVVTIFAGAHIKHGNYSEGKGITHVNILRTIEAMYGLPKAGLQQEKAAEYGISDDYIITDVFMTVPKRSVK